MKHRYSQYFPALVYVFDVILLNLSILIPSLIYFDIAYLSGSGSLLFMVSNGTWITLSLLTRNYRIHRPLVLSNNINRYIMTIIYYVALLFCFLYLSQLYDVSRQVLLVHLSLFFILSIIQRSLIFFVLDFIRKRGFNHRRVLIIGNKTIASRLKASFARHPEYGYDVAGYISQEGMLNYNFESLAQIMERRKIDELYVCDASILNISESIKEFFSSNRAIIKLVSDLQIDMDRAELVQYNDFPVFRLLPHSSQSLKIRLLKRGFDLGFSSAVMLGGMPIFFLITCITKATSAGPVFYKQQRIGRDGKPFFIFKFRSMYVDAEKLGPQLSKDNDPRITGWGRFMRKTRLDELPQFYNVLLGHMSVVGPRPERQHFIEQIIERAPEYYKLLSIKPGITSIGQVKYGYAENVDQMLERMEFDLIYLGRLKFSTDVNVIMDTVRVMVAGKGK